MKAADAKHTIENPEAFENQEALRINGLSRTRTSVPVPLALHGAYHLYDIEGISEVLSNRSQIPALTC
jgi:hypothetical protein